MNYIVRASLKHHHKKQIGGRYFEKVVAEKRNS